MKALALLALAGMAFGQNTVRIASQTDLYLEVSGDVAPIPIYRAISYVVGAATVKQNVGAGAILGISIEAAANGGTFRTARYGVITCEFASPPVAGNVATTNGGLCVDSGQTTFANISHSLGIVGRILALNAGKCLNCADVNLLVQPVLGQLIDNASAPTALAGTPTLCPGGQWPTGITATGNATGCAQVTQVSGKNVPFNLGVVDLTAQGAALASQALFTPTSTGFYQISYTAKVTRAATTSSVLGGTTGFVLNYTDGGDSVVQTLTAQAFNQAGAAVVIATGNIGNATTTKSHGEMVVYALTGVPVTFNWGYTSVGTTTMQYELHVRFVGL